MKISVRDNDDLVILDYGYFYKKDPKILHCALDGTQLQYTENFDMLYCKKCGKKYGISDIIYRMGLTEENYKDMNENQYKGPLIVQLAGMRYDPVKKQYKPI